MKRKFCFICALIIALAGRTAVAGTLVQFQIWSGLSNYLGEVDVELYDRDKPVTVRNFLNYVEYGLYQNSFLHRDPVSTANGLTDFVIQGGEFYVIDPGASNAVVQGIPTFPEIVDEFNVGTRYSNTYGTLAMAKVAGYTNSATSSWFFNLTNNVELDAADTNNLFCVFGTVLRGTNVLNQFIGRSYGDGLQDLGSPFDSLPVNYVGNTAPYTTNFYYVSITVLTAQIAVGSVGSRQISWNSINGETNLVQFATNFPPVWQTLASTNGNGGPITVTDTSQNISYRYYRINVLF